MQHQYFTDLTDSWKLFQGNVGNGKIGPFNGDQGGMFLPDHASTDSLVSVLTRSRIFRRTRMHGTP